MPNAPTTIHRPRTPGRGDAATFGWSTGVSVGAHLTVLAAAAWLTLASGDGAGKSVPAIAFVAAAEPSVWVAEREPDRELELPDEVEPTLVEESEFDTTLLEDALPPRESYSAPREDSHAIAMQLALRWGQGQPAPRAAAGAASDAPAATAPPAGPAAPAPEPIVVPAKLVAHVDPEYPRMSRRLDEEGTLTVRIHVAADGTVSGIDLVRSSGYERLDRAALDAIEEWRFEPATRDGAAIPWTLEHRVTFALRAAAAGR